MGSAVGIGYGDCWHNAMPLYDLASLGIPLNIAAAGTTIDMPFRYGTCLEPKPPQDTLNAVGSQTKKIVRLG